MLLGVSRAGVANGGTRLCACVCVFAPCPQTRGGCGGDVSPPTPGPVLARCWVTAGMFPCTPPSRDGVMARYQLPPSMLTRAEQRERAGKPCRHRAAPCRQSHAMPCHAVPCHAMPSAVPVLCRHAGDAPSTDAHANPGVQSLALPAKLPGTVLPDEPALLRHHVRLGRDFPGPAQSTWLRRGGELFRAVNDTAAFGDLSKSLCTIHYVE